MLRELPGVELEPLSPESLAKTAFVRGNATFKSYQFEALMAIRSAWLGSKKLLLRLPKPDAHQRVPKLYP